MKITSSNSNEKLKATLQSESDEEALAMLEWFLMYKNKFLEDTTEEKKVTTDEEVKYCCCIR